MCVTTAPLSDRNHSTPQGFLHHISLYGGALVGREERADGTAPWALPPPDHKGPRIGS